MSKGKLRQGGFTLIELMVVVIIMGIIFALVAYSVSKMLPNMQIATAGQQLLGGVGKARMLAVTKSSIVWLKLVPGGGGSNDSIVILIKSPNDTLIQGGNWNLVSSTTLSQGVKFNFGGTESYYFLRDGSVEGNLGVEPIIQCINRTATQESLSVMRATGIAELKH